MRTSLAVFTLIAILFGCNKDEPVPLDDYTMKFGVNKSVAIEGKGFEIFDYEELDLIEISISNDGEITETLPIKITTSGTAIAGEDYPALPDTIIYNPYLEAENSDYNNISFRVNDDFVYEGASEVAVVTFEYQLNGEVIKEEVSFDILDNDFQYELTWNNDANQPENTPLELSVRRNHASIIFSLGSGEQQSENRYTFDITGSRDKWLWDSGFGCDVQYLDQLNPSGVVNYTATIHLPDGGMFSWEDQFAADDHLSDETSHHIPMIIQHVSPEESLYEAEFVIIFRDQTTSRYVIDY